MEKNKISVRMLSSATTVAGQGVGSAYMEMVSLVKEQSDLFNILEKGDKGKYQICHIHTVDPQWLFHVNKHHVNVMYVHFIPTTLNGSIRLPKLAFKIFKGYVKYYYKKADEIVVVNPIFIKPLVELGIKEENITYIPNYVSKENFFKQDKTKREESRNLYKIPLDKFTVLGCGQVQTRKGVKDFIECAKRNPDKFFVWAGGFSFGVITDGYDELKKIMENPPENVKFLGIIQRNKMNDIFNMVDMLFMPSFDELFPMSILEASNSGTPILLRNLELYEGILWDKYDKADDIDGFDREIKRLATDKKYFEEYSKKANEIASFYSKENVGNIWREYYPRILEKWKDKKKFKK